MGASVEAVDQFRIWFVVGRCGSFWVRCGSLWVVVDRFGFVVDRCGSFWVVLGGSSF